MTGPFERTVMIEAAPAEVWPCLTEPALMAQWMGEPEMELEVETVWTVGTAIRISGIHHVRFENRGVVLEYEVNKRLSYTHLSSVSRLSDDPKHYVQLLFELIPVDRGTELKLTITNFPTEVIFHHLNFYWRVTMEKIRLFVAQRSSHHY